MFVARIIISHFGGGLPPTSLCRTYGAPRSILLPVATNISLLRSYEPPPCPTQQALGQLWDSFGTALGQPLGQTSLLMSTVTTFVPEKSKKYSFVPRTDRFQRIIYATCVAYFAMSIAHLSRSGSRRIVALSVM